MSNTDLLKKHGYSGLSLNGDYVFHKISSHEGIPLYRIIFKSTNCGDTYEPQALYALRDKYLPNVNKFTVTCNIDCKILSVKILQEIEQFFSDIYCAMIDSIPEDRLYS